jgi:hypothetical protein
MKNRTVTKMDEIEDQFVETTRAVFAALGMAGSFDELRCREIYRRTRVQTIPLNQEIPAEQLSLF